MQTNVLITADDYYENTTITTTNANNNNLNEQIKNANLYLQKHKLDVILLPNKKVKLSDLKSSQPQQQIINQNYEEDFDDDDDYEDDFEDDEDEEEDYDYDEDDIESDDFIDDEDDEGKIIDKFIIDNCKLEHQQQQTSNDNNDINESINHQHRDLKIKRKKREPSLKLIQKLTIDDLQLIVNCIQNSNAQVLIADVAKSNYIDKILKVRILNDQYQLSNGSREALLKKSMFPKEISLLFDSFIKSLCTERIFYENVSVSPPHPSNFQYFLFFC